MEKIYLSLTIWFAFAVIAVFVAKFLKITVALVEIIVGIIVGYVASILNFIEYLSLNENWMKLLVNVGAIFLTFLAGSELNTNDVKTKFKEVSVVGLLGFLAPFVGCFLVSYYLLGWDTKSSLLCGIALSTTSMAVVYSVMYEFGLNKTEFGKGILGACFVNDLGTVIALGLIFSPFTVKTLIFITICMVAIFILPPITEKLIIIFANKKAAFRTKWITFITMLFAFLSIWSGSEPVLPAYILGMVMAKIFEKEPEYISRLRTLTVGFFTPLYFLRAGALVSIPSLIAAPLIFILLLSGKVLSKIFGLYPIIAKFRINKKERWYYTLLMSTGLTFGSIAALFGLANNIISQEQYSVILLAVIASAVIPTIIANKYFLPIHITNEK